MKYLLSILFSFLLIACCKLASAQYIPNASAYSYKGILTRESLQMPQGCGLPNTALNAPDTKKPAFYWDSCNEKLYIFSPKIQDWVTNTGSIDSIFITNTDSIFIISGSDTIFIGESNAMDTAYERNDTLFGVKQGNEFFIASLTTSAICPNGLNQPGYVTWSGAGLTFDVTAAEYTINCIHYNSAAGQVTLDPADATNPRHDVIALDTNGAIVKITGIPSPSPATPQVDPNSQVYLTFIDVPAGATVPGGVNQELIYDENAEIYLPTTAGLTANFNNTTNPFHLSKSIDVSASNGGMGTYMTFTRPTKDNINNYDVLKLYVNLKAVFGSTANIRIQFLDGATVISNTLNLTNNMNFKKGTAGSYQAVAVALNLFTFTSTQFDRVRIIISGPSGGAYFDYIQFQGGISPPPVTGIYQDTTYARGDSLFGFKAGKEFFIASTTGQPGPPGTKDTLWYNVKWFGALGDGVTDDRPSIQAADDYVSSVGGGYIWFPAGTYIVHSPVYRHSYVNWEGVKDGSIIKNVAPAQIDFGTQSVMFMGNYNPSAYDTIVARFYRGHMGTFGNKMAIVDSISRFHVGDIVLIESMTGWVGSDGGWKPYVTRFNEVDSIYNDTVVFHYQIDTLLTDARIHINGHFISNPNDPLGHPRYMVKNVTTRNLVFESEGNWILGMTSLGCSWENIRIKAAEIFSGNGMAWTTARNIYGQWWKQVSEFAIGCHNTTITGINAHYINRADDEHKPFIKFGENSHAVVLKDVFIDAGNFDGKGVWFGASTESVVDNIHVTSVRLRQTHIEFSDNDLGESPASFVNNNTLRNGYFKNVGNLESYVLMQKSTSAGELKNNIVSDVTFIGPVGDSTALVLDGYRPQLKDIYTTEGRITGGDSLYKGIVSGGTLADIYTVHGNDSNVIIKDVSDINGKVRSNMTDIDFIHVPDNTTIEGQLHYNKSLDQLNFRHNGVTTDLLTGTGGGGGDSTILQPLIPGYGILGSNYNGTAPQTWAVDTSILNGQIFIDSSNIEYFVDGIANSPIGTEASGTKYLVGIAATGTFTGHANDIATLIGAVWNFQTPVAGDNLVLSNNVQPTTFYHFDGTNWLLMRRSLSIGGDQVGADIDIGTKDFNDFRFMTNNALRERIDVNGRHYFNNFINSRSNNYLKIDSATGRLDTASFTPLVLTTTGTAGPSLLRNDTLNIPVYSSGGGGSTLDTAEITPNLYAGLGYSDTKKIQLALNLAVSLRRQLVIAWNNERAANLWRIDSAVLLSSNSNILIRNSKLKLTDSSRDNIFRTGNCGVGITNPASNPMINISIIGQGSAVLEGADNPRSSGGWTKNLGTHVDIYQASQLNTYGTDSGKVGRTQTGDWRNHGVIIAYTTNVKVQGISLMYLHCYGLEFERCRDVIVKDIPFFMPGYPANGDTTRLMRNMGPIDFALSANNVLVDNVHGWSEDDNLAFNVTNISNGAGSVGNLYPVGDTSNSARDSMTNIVVTNVDGGSFANIIRFLNPGNGVITRGVTMNNLIGRPNTGRTYSAAYGFTRVRAITIGAQNPPYAGANPLGQISRFNINNIIIDSAKNVIDLVTSLSNSNISNLKKNTVTYNDFPLISNSCDTCISHWSNLTGTNGAFTIERGDDVNYGQATLTLVNPMDFGTAATRLRLLNPRMTTGSGFFRGSHFYAVGNTMNLANYENGTFVVSLGSGSAANEKFSITADGSNPKFTTAASTMRLILNTTGTFNVGIQLNSSGTAIWQWFANTTKTAIFNQALAQDAIGATTTTNNVYVPAKFAVGYTAGQTAFNFDVAGTGRLTSTLTTAGLIKALAAKTAAYTTVATDEVIKADATSGAFNVTLLTAVGRTGQLFTIKKTDNSANAVTVNTTSSQTIDGSTTYALSAQYKYVTVISDGSNWLIIANN